MDGIGQPAVSGFFPPWPGQEVINAGILLAGEFGDSLAGLRPPWTTDGSFLVFRQLKQLVPEFSEYLLKYAPWIPGWTQQQSADLMGSRMVGRWQSGAPVDTNPLVDDPVHAMWPTINNDFNYDHSSAGARSVTHHDPTLCEFQVSTSLPINRTVHSRLISGKLAIPFRRLIHSSDTILRKNRPRADEKDNVFASFFTHN